ncbi:ATP-binding protein [Streptomyces sp. NPDC091281]|uniref:ATP-binding protein n=1 Tax=Streptomyces sp. NPDC091281 TaxID=3365985 RepID=UPI003816302C
MGPRRVPLHRSLLARLFAASVLVAVCAVAATAWITVTTTTGALRTERGQSLADDTRVYDALIGYAATHRDWDGVRPLVDRLAARTGRAITLTTPARTRIADSEPGARPLPERAAARVDPLRPDAALSDGSGAVDPRAVGPYRLTAKERHDVRAEAEATARCMRDKGVGADAVELPSGRYELRFDRPELARKLAEYCDVTSYRQTPPTQLRALDELAGRAAACLGLDSPEGLTIADDFTWDLVGAAPPSATPAAARECVDDARRDQLRPYVAPAALLFVGAPGRTDEPSGTALSGGAVLRIVAAAAAVLAVAVAVTVAVGLRLIRPLRSLVAAAQRPAERMARVPVRTDDEIGRLTAAFNDFAERRERLEEQRRSMVGDVAHELRSPLTNIRSWLEAAQDGLTPTDDRLLALLLDEAVLLQHVIDDLRDLAAADAGRLTLHREPVRTADVLDRVAAAHRGTAERAGVRLDRHDVGDTGELYADPLRLQQIVGNLVGNAVRHTPSGGRVALSARREGRATLLQVADTGAGIAAEDLPHVFDRFWRADKSRTRQTGGSGLGLSIARQLAEAHGGSVTARSTVGRGSVFTVRLPHEHPDRSAGEG